MDWREFRLPVAGEGLTESLPAIRALDVQAPLAWGGGDSAAGIIQIG